MTQPKQSNLLGQYRCSKCGKWKAPVEFGKDVSSAIGLKSYCLDCARKHTNASRRGNGYKEWYREYYATHGNDIRAREMATYKKTTSRIEKSFELVVDTSGDYTAGKRFSTDEVIFGLRFSNFSDETVLQNHVSKYIVRGNELYTPRGRKVSIEEINP